MQSTSGVWNGMAFGPTQQVHLLALEGIYDLPQVVSTHKFKSLVGKMFRGTVRPSGLTFTAVFGLIPNTDTPAGFDTLLASVLTATGIQETTDLPFQFAGSTKYIMCHPVRRSVPIALDHAQTRGEVTVEFFAVDHTITTGTP